VIGYVTAEAIPVGFITPTAITGSMPPGLDNQVATVALFGKPNERVLELDRRPRAGNGSTTRDGVGDPLPAVIHALRRQLVGKTFAKYFRVVCVAPQALSSGKRFVRGHWLTCAPVWIKGYRPKGDTPLSASGMPTLRGQVAGQLVAQRGLSEPVAEQRPELHEVAADERDDAAAACGRPAVAAGVEPRGADRDAIHLSHGRERWEQRRGPVLRGSCL
jgi:hypothetical protein